MVLEGQRDAGIACRRKRGEHRIDHPASLRLDRVRLGGEVRAIEAGGHAQDGALERHRPLEPALHALGRDLRVVAEAGTAQELAGREDVQPELTGSAVQRGDVGDAPLAGVMERELEVAPARLGCLLEHLLETDVARLEAQMPAERVGAEDQPRCCAHGRITVPPSATSAAPVTKLASSEARNRMQLAISTGCPVRPSGATAAYSR